jgi:probable HAF family extracellular repeat protein
VLGKISRHFFRSEGTQARKTPGFAAPHFVHPQSIADINNSGQVVGISEGAGEVYRPFLCEDGVMYDLQELLKPNSGWVLYSTAAINDRGQITGVGYLHGRERPYLLTPKGIKSRRRP